MKIYSGNRRNIEIDSLRFIAVFLVLGRHMQDVPDDLYFIIKYPLKLWKATGWIGVDLFFVLSGFLVSGLLFKELKFHNTISFKNFFLRRGLKIYPLFYLYLITVFCLWGYQLPLTALSEALFVQNYFSYYYIHSWSLAVEEHFYILLPLLLIFLKKWNALRALPYLIIILCFGLTLLRVFLSGSPFSYELHVFPSHLRFDSLFCGVLIAYILYFGNERSRNYLAKCRIVNLIAGILLVSPMFFLFLGENVFVWTYGFTFLYVGFGLILIYSLTIDLRKFKLVGLLARIGQYSYGIYLWHMPIKNWTYDFLKDTPFLISTGIYLVVSILFGIIVSRLIEYPILKFRDRVFPSRSVV